MIFRYKHDANFTTIDNGALKDSGISFGARGLLAYILSLPEDWKLYEKELQNHTTDGKCSIHSLLIELLNTGYVYRGSMKHDSTYDYYADDFRHTKDEWETYIENQQGPTRKSDTPLSENQQGPLPENRQLQSTNIQKTETKEKNKGDFSFPQNPQEEKENPPTVSFQTHGDLKKTTTAIYERSRKLWNELGINPACRLIGIRYSDIDELNRVLIGFPWEQIENAVRNYAWHRKKYLENPHEWKRPLYTSLSGFLKAGIDKYCDDDALDELFKEEKKYGQIHGR